MQPFKLNRTQRYSAGQAWETGGHLLLGLWLSREYPHFTVKQYAEAVKAAREELGDDTDYSQEAEALGKGVREG